MPVLECEPKWDRASYAKELCKRPTQQRRAWRGKSLVIPAEVPVKTKYSFAQFFKEKVSRISRQPWSIQARIHVPISVSIQRLLDLLSERGKDDYGALDPTQFAFKTALEFVLYAEHSLGRETRSAPVVDSEGGIRITWRNGDRQIKLICPAAPSAPIYIYQYSSVGGSSVLNQNVTSTTLTGRLSWLLHGDQSEQPPK